MINKDVKIVKSQLYEDKADSLITFFFRIPLVYHDGLAL